MESKFLFYLGIITWVATIIVILLITFRSIIDVANGLGLLPKFIDNYFQRNERRRFANYLDHLGITPRIPKYRALSDKLDLSNNITLDTPEIVESIKAIILEHVEKGNFTVGDFSKTKITNYVNLRKAIINFTRGNEISTLLSCFIQNTAVEKSIEFDCIISRKGACDILGFLVAHKIGKPFLLFDDISPNIQKIDGKETSRFLDFQINGISKAIVVDDSCTGGGSIVGMIKELRKLGIQTDHAFVVFNRKEVNPYKSLEPNQISLHSILELGDTDLNTTK